MEKRFNENANKGGVYQIRNLHNNKVYIGSAKCFKKRANQHETRLNAGKHSNKYLLASWKKHGSDNFLFEVLEVVDGSTSKRRSREQHYINQYLENWEDCYNLCKKVVRKQGPWSKTPEETRKARKGKRYSPATEFKPGHTPWTKINGHREETKAVIGEKSKKMWNKKSHQRKMAKIHSSEEFRTFQGNRIKALWNDPEYKEKRLKYYNSKEGKQRAKDRANAQWSDPLMREKMVSIHNSLESKIKKSLSHLGNKEAARYLLDKKWLSQQFCVDNLSAPEIARKLNVSKHTVYKWLKNYELM